MTDQSTVVDAAPAAPPEPPRLRILLTCGVGDFIAMESHFTPAEREAVVAIHWATRARAALMEIIPFVFPNVEDHVIERDTWGPAFTDDFCISSRDQLPDLDPAVLDWSVQVIADEIRAGARRFSGSTLVATALCEISTFALPDQYIVAHPYSDNASTLERDFTAAEWHAVQRYAQHEGLPLVIVNKGERRMPRQFPVIDLSNSLTVLEAIEVTKRAAGFVGCASFPAVIAAQSLPRGWLFVKANHSLKKHYFWFYYAPHDTNDFVTGDLQSVLPHA